MAFKGADAPPHVILHGPSGEVFDTGTGNAAVQARAFAALKNDATDITEVVIEKPAGGRWTVEVAPDSSRLVEAIQADGTRPVAATAKVSGSGHDRRLAYTVKNLPAGSRVEFVEAGDGGGGRIGIVKADGSGTLAFHPAGGAPGKRTIQAVVYGADGFLTGRTDLGTYAAPAPGAAGEGQEADGQALRQAARAALARGGLQPAGRHPLQRRAEPHPHGQALDDLDRAAGQGHEAHDHDHRLDEVGRWPDRPARFTTRVKK